MLHFKQRYLQTILTLLIAVSFHSYALAAATVNHNHLNISRISDKSLDSMRKLKVLFGHQSIGMNTLAGILNLISQNNRYRIVITEVSSPADFNSAKLGHFRISANRNPLGKISEFNNRIRNGYGKAVDAAFFKLCPLDIGPDTDVNSLFDIYKRTMDSLKSAYPAVIFVHVTCPVINGEDIANVKRNQFNNLLIREYNGKDYIFDIADIQSTRQNGTKSQFNYNGTSYRKLCSEYSMRDRIHLNNQGRIQAARGMIYLLSDIAENK